MESKIVTKKKLIQKPEKSRPHVILLGSGASRASFPNGDASGHQLPVMDDLIATVGLKSLLKEHNIDLSGNFETIYVNIKDENLRKEIEEKINNYFSKLSLPENATHYDRLLLALREKDAIFTFNWDPFLLDAYKRNNGVVPLPSIFFLHGNVRIGSCKQHPQCWGYRGYSCNVCNKKFSNVPLLYPIKQKNYFKSNQYTAQSWKCAKNLLASAFTITIFGYGAPTSDSEAVQLLQAAWLNNSTRAFEHIEIIDILDLSTLYKRWGNFTPTQHLNSISSFEKSRLWRWPRRTCESLFYPTYHGIPCEDFPLPLTDNLQILQQYIKKIAQYE